MSNAPRPFQIFLYFGFGGLFVLSIILFTTYSGGSSDVAEQVGTVEIWGTLDQSTIQSHINELRRDNETFRSVQYRQIDERTFDNVLVTAIAEGRQPDMVLIPHTKLVQRRSMLFPVTYDTISRREIADWYLDGFEVFARPDGLYAIPFAVDPLIMYWNRDLYATNGFAEAPRTWEAIVNEIVPAMVRRSTDRTISLSPIALGEYRNNVNALGTISALLLQSGSHMVVEDRGEYSVDLNTGQATGSRSPLTSTIQFYTQFARPSSPLYTWSRTKASDREEFLATNLATYFGYGSEADSLRERNPNLNFDAAPLPQSADATVNRTYGQFYGLAILRTANNVNGAYSVARALTEINSITTLANEFSMAPPYRASISAGVSSPTAQIIYNSALIARGWLSPSDTDTGQLFQQAIDDVLAGRSAANRAASDLVSRLRQQF